jgi:hypothetical protein
MVLKPLHGFCTECHISDNISKESLSLASGMDFGTVYVRFVSWILCAVHWNGFQGK